MNHSIYSSNGKYHTVDGKVFNTIDDANAHSLAKRKEIEAKYGYFPDDSTWGRQGLTAAVDTRTTDEKFGDKDYTPKKRDVLSPIDRQIAEYEAEGARQREGEEYKNLNLHERLALDLRKKRDREEAESKAEAVKAAHLKANSAKLQAIDQLIWDEQFNPESDQRFREQLRKLKLAYQEPDADPAEVEQLTAAVNQELLARQANQQAGLLQEREALEAALQRNSEQLFLGEPEPEAKAEHTPDPYGYEPPKVDLSEAEPQKPTIKVEVNRDQKPFSCCFDLQELMEASGSFTDDQISEVRQAAISGDESAMESAISKYAV